MYVLFYDSLLIFKNLFFHFQLENSTIFNLLHYSLLTNNHHNNISNHTDIFF
jgi:hypothetical protein